MCARGEKKKENATTEYQSSANRDNPSFKHITREDRNRFGVTLRKVVMQNSFLYTPKRRLK